MKRIVDRAAVEAEVARRRGIREREFGRWLVRRLAVALAAFYVLAFVIRALTPSATIGSMDNWNRAVFFAVPFVMALFVTFVAERLMFSGLGMDAERLTARITKEVDSLTGPGWPMRTLGAALVLAVCAGVPAAIVIAMTRRPEVLSRPSDATIAVFVSGVVLWGVLMAFAIRAATLHVYRDLLVKEGVDAS